MYSRNSSLDPDGIRKREEENKKTNHNTASPLLTSKIEPGILVVSY